MASTYPTTLDTLATNKTNSTVASTDHPNHHNDLADAVNKIEAELGTLPKGSAATVKARIAAVETTAPINSQAGASYTAVATDAGKIVESTGSSAHTHTVPANVFTAGQFYEVHQKGTGAVSVAAGASMTMRPASPQSVSAQYKSLRVRFYSATECVVE